MRQILGAIAIAIIVFAHTVTNAKPITLEHVSDFSASELSASELNVGLDQNLVVGVPLINWQTGGTIGKGLVSISSEAAHVAVTQTKLGPTTEECFYTPVPVETTATPEPMSMLLLGSGLLGAAAGIRYRRRNASN